MSISEWRKKIKKCKFCKNHEGRYIGLVGAYGYCKAKDVYLNVGARKPFCKLFDLKEE